MTGSPITEEELQLALAHRTIIGQATGILMERYKLTADQAFRELSAASQSTQGKLWLIASKLADSGVWDFAVPAAPPQRLSGSLPDWLS